MQVKMLEPLTARYLFVNPDTNQVHLLMPIIGGTEIATDNTCRSATSLKTFFGKYSSAKKNADSALNILQKYKEALQHDIGLLPDSDPQKVLKVDRSKQITNYINSLKAVQGAPEFDTLYGIDNESYPKPIQSIIKSGGNLFSMVLRPADGFDTHLNSINPVFSVNRERDRVFFDALTSGFSALNIQPRESLEDGFLNKYGIVAILNEDDFRDLQVKMGEYFGADFFVTNEGKMVTKKYIDEEMGDNEMNAEDYVHALIPYCTKNLMQSLESSPFRRIKNNDSFKLCFLTQFYLGELNIYCAAHGISAKNFGNVLDGDSKLSETLVARVKNAVEGNGSAESEIIRTINEHKKDFKLNETLTVQQIEEVNSRVLRHFDVVENMENADEFMLADPTVNGKFVTHQGAICTDFTELVQAGFPAQRSGYFTEINSDFSKMNYYVANNNDFVAYNLDVDLHNAQEYLTNLILSGHPELALNVINENYEIIKSMPQSSLLAILNATNKSGVSFLGYLAKGSITDFPQVAALLTKSNLLACMSTKNKLGDTILHSIVAKPENLQIVVNALSGDTLASLVKLQNSRGDNVLQSAKKPDCLEIINHGLLKPATSGEDTQEVVEVLNNPTVNSSIKSQKIKLESDVKKEPLPTVRGETNPHTKDVNPDKKFSPTSVARTESNLRPSLGGGITFFSPDKSKQSTKAAYKLILNSTSDEVLESGDRNCFVWQLQDKRSIAYISAEGEVTFAKMPMNKAFGFQAELQKLTKKINESQDSSCALVLTKDEIDSLISKTAISSDVFSEALSGSDVDTDNETSDDDSLHF